MALLEYYKKLLTVSFISKQDVYNKNIWYENLEYEMMSNVAILSLYAHILVAQMTYEFLILRTYLYMWKYE